MVVIDSEKEGLPVLHRPLWFDADRAITALPLEHLVVLGDSDSVGPLEVCAAMVLIASINKRPLVGNTPFARSKVELAARTVLYPLEVSWPHRL